MFVPCLEDRPRIDIEDLDRSGIISGDQHTTISSDLTAMSDAIEAIDRLDEFARANGEDFHSGAAGNSKIVAWRCEGI